MIRKKIGEKSANKYFRTTENRSYILIKKKWSGKKNKVLHLEIKKRRTIFVILQTFIET